MEVYTMFKVLILIIYDIFSFENRFKSVPPTTLLVGYVGYRVGYNLIPQATQTVDVVDVSNFTSIAQYTRKGKLFYVCDATLRYPDNYVMAIHCDGTFASKKDTFQCYERYSIESKPFDLTVMNLDTTVDISNFTSSSVLYTYNGELFYVCKIFFCYLHIILSNRCDEPFVTKANTLRNNVSKLIVRQVQNGTCETSVSSDSYCYYCFQHTWIQFCYKFLIWKAPYDIIQMFPKQQRNQIRCHHNLITEILCFDADIDNVCIPNKEINKQATINETEGSKTQNEIYEEKFENNITKLHPSNSTQIENRVHFESVLLLILIFVLPACAITLVVIYNYKNRSHASIAIDFGTSQHGYAYVSCYKGKMIQRRSEFKSAHCICGKQPSIYFTSNNDNICFGVDAIRAIERHAHMDKDASATMGNVSLELSIIPICLLIL